MVIKLNVTLGNDDGNGQRIGFYNTSKEDYERVFFFDNVDDQEECIWFINIYMSRKYMINGKMGLRLNKESKDRYQKTLQSGMRILDTDKVLLLGWSQIGFVMKDRHQSDIYSLVEMCPV